MDDKLNKLIERVKIAQGWCAQSKDSLAQAAYKELTLGLNELTPEPETVQEKPKKEKKNKKEKYENTETPTVGNAETE